MHTHTHTHRCTCTCDIVQCTHTWFIDLLFLQLRVPSSFLLQLLSHFLCFPLYLVSHLLQCLQLTLCSTQILSLLCQLCFNTDSTSGWFPLSLQLTRELFILLIQCCLLNLKFHQTYIEYKVYVYALKRETPVNMYICI